MIDDEDFERQPVSLDTAPGNPPAPGRDRDDQADDRDATPAARPSCARRKPLDMIALSRSGTVARAPYGPLGPIDLADLVSESRLPEDAVIFNNRRALIVVRACRPGQYRGTVLEMEDASVSEMLPPDEVDSDDSPDTLKAAALKAAARRFMEVNARRLAAYETARREAEENVRWRGKSTRDDEEEASIRLGIIDLDVEHDRAEEDFLDAMRKADRLAVEVDGAIVVAALPGPGTDIPGPVPLIIPAGKFVRTRG